MYSQVISGHPRYLIGIDNYVIGIYYDINYLLHNFVDTYEILKQPAMETHKMQDDIGWGLPCLCMFLPVGWVNQCDCQSTGR
ncbi:MAG: hypothetical protein FWB78_09585, partial [Treponema sp.]|nr:hypothetical protein [Treponema sp.]